MFYLIVIIGSMLLIALCNTLLGLPSGLGETWWQILLSGVCGTVSVIAWDGLQAFLIRRLPEKWFVAGSQAFGVGKRERTFYRKLHINEWKDLVPELGGFTNFRKSQFTDPRGPAYLARFLLESNYGVAIHLANALLGSAIILLPWCSTPAIALPIALVNFILNILPLAILRFNTAPLHSIYLRSLRRGA